MSEFCHQVNFDGNELLARPDTLSYGINCNNSLNVPWTPNISKDYETQQAGLLKSDFHSSFHIM